uniref:Uncharacterized protein n=1 Tax=Anguilla anguilla TaxID=7936 RepID=A0A0E9SBV4_ANGAN
MIQIYSIQYWICTKKRLHKFKNIMECKFSNLDIDTVNKTYRNINSTIDRVFTFEKAK